jgi:hypothetical protein
VSVELVNMDADAPDVDRVGSRGTAVFSADGKRRRYLTRNLSPSAKRVSFIMLNPSDATADDNDPTIARCEGFARREGAGVVEVANLSDYIETDSRKLDALYQQGVLTDSRSWDYVRRALWCDVVICAWGAHPWARGRLAGYLRGFPAFEATIQFKCLGKTKTGAPRHPLYLPGNAPLIDWPGSLL